MIKVIDGNYNKLLLPYSAKGVFWKGIWRTPISARITKTDAAKDAIRSLGGAVLGGAIAGGAGAIVGVIAGGNKGKVFFILKTLEGDQLICICPAGEYQRFAKHLSGYLNNLGKQKKLLMDGRFIDNRSVNTFLLGLLGPFYMARFGIIPFVLSILSVIATIGIGWLALPFVAVYLHRRERRTWLKQYGERLQNANIPQLEEERRADFEREHGVI